VSAPAVPGVMPAAAAGMIASICRRDTVAFVLSPSLAPTRPLLPAGRLAVHVHAVT
jgi:hypothetical protein